MKIILGFTSVIFLVAVFFILFSINDNKDFAIKSAKQEIQGMAKLVSETTGFGIDHFDFNYVQNAINWLKVDHRVVSIKIENEDNMTVANYQNPLIKSAAPLKTIKIGQPFIKDQILYLMAPIFSRNAAFQKTKVKGKVLIALSLASLNQEIWANQIQLILFAAGVFFVGILITLIFSNKITQPIIHLSEVSNQVADKRNYGLRATKKSDDELGVLIDQFNEMLEQIQKQDTALKNLNEELETRVLIRTRDLEIAKDSAEESNKAKSRFLSCMSHELRTPLNAILGFGQLIKMGPQESLSQNQEDQINEILKAGDHLLSLINEILDLAQIESGRLTISIENIELIGIIRENLALVQPMAQEKNIQIISSFLPKEQMYVRVDKTRMKQIILNLLSNAIKYNNENGKVTLTCKKDEGGFVTLSVRDNGIGIDQEKQKSIFVPFDRLGIDKITTEGTGIGLSISKNLIELMGGSIEFESKVGDGSCFSIKIPHGEKPASGHLSQENSNISPSPVLGATKFKILYVDNSTVSLNLVKHLLGDRKDIKILTTQQPNLGLDLASSHHPDLIIWNIDLPGFDGDSALKLLKGNKATNQIPVFAISDNVMDKSDKNSNLQGFDGYITKPLDINNFLKQINRVLK